MNAEILSIGTELLVGSILNTNARHLSERLAENSIDVYRQTTVGDNVRRIAEAFLEAASRADLVVSSGGLGPTADDVTAEGLALAVKKTLTLHRPTLDYIEKRMAARGLAMSDLVARQCRVPKDAAIFTNGNGTAPGILCEAKIAGRKKYFVVLPGPPREMQPLFEKMLPVVLEKAKVRPGVFVIRSVRLTGLIESQVAERVQDLLSQEPPVTVGIYARAGEVELKIMSKADRRSTAEREAKNVERAIRSRFGDVVFGIDGDTLQSVVLDLLKSRKKKLSAAESCTGGLFSSLITDVDGSSDCFKGGIVAYRDEVKHGLGLTPAFLEKYDVVSKEVASALAVAAKKRFRSDYAVGITGLLTAPAKNYSQKTRGTVCIAVATPSSVILHETTFLEKKRADIKLRAAYKALDLLRLSLL